MNHRPDNLLIPSFLELEFTTYCQLKCIHCLSDSGPHGDTGTMTATDWEKTIDQAAALGVATVQFIGGEPTLDPRLSRLARHALRAGLTVDIYTNLVHVTDQMWSLFQLPGVSLGFSWYAADPTKHAEVTGSRGSFARTRANLCEVLQRGIPVRAGIVHVVEGQDIEKATAELRRLGVTNIQVDHVRRIGRAAEGQQPQISELCGRCGRDRAAIGRDGSVTPCVLGRFLVAGNVRDTSLADILDGDRWREIVAAVPAQNACVTCTPADSNDCNPSRKPCMNWEPHATRLAAEVTHPVSRWRPVVAGLPRHKFVPRWWSWAPGGPGCYYERWEPRDGAAKPADWAAAAYGDRSLVTQVGALHADHSDPGNPNGWVTGLPTSSATMPGLLIQMFQHAMIGDGMDILDVGTGSGYGCALLTSRLGDHHVTSVDVDGYLTQVAARRMGSIGLHPEIVTCDATGPLPGTYDRIVSTVSVRPVPADWLIALRPGGRLVTTIAGTGLILTADTTPDGGAAGRIEPDRAGFMPTRTGPEYPGGLLERFAAIRDADGEQVGTGRYPVVHVGKAWELYSMLGVIVPGVDHHYQEHQDGQRTVWLVHPDGSWARATGTPDGLPAVHQSGPRRLWDIVDDIRHAWLRDGSLPAYGADATIAPDGTIRLKRGRWEAVVS